MVNRQPRYREAADATTAPGIAGRLSHEAGPTLGAPGMAGEHQTPERPSVHIRLDASGHYRNAGEKRLNDYTLRPCVGIV
jgi:hypothetical protein